MRSILLSCALLWAVSADAAVVRTVGSGKTHATIQACASVAVAGDTCEVYAGTYTEATITPANSGTAGSPITFRSHAGETATVVGKFVVTDRAYITIDGFRFTGGQAVWSQDGGTVSSPAPITTNHITVRNNAVVWPVNNTTAPAFYLFGDYLLIENNDVSGGSSDFTDIGGDYVVVRNNVWRDHYQNASQGGEAHLDFVQCMGSGSLPTLNHVLVEGNIVKNCTDATGNCHVFLHRTGSGQYGANDIVRFNYSYNINGSGVTFGGSGDDVRAAYSYHNTFAAGTLGVTSGDCTSFQNVTGGAAKNNICYNSITGGTTPFYAATSTGITYGGNLAYTTGYSGTWTSPYSAETTYATLRNQDPLLANASTDASIQATSPAVGAGVALTTVAADDSGSGTTLKVADAGYFQAGWVDTRADWIQIGASTLAQVASINYATNTITLASGVSRSAGDAVYLSRTSTGARVLTGATPDVGASAFLTVPSAPSAVSVVMASGAPTLQWTHASVSVGQFQYALDADVAVGVGFPAPSGTTVQFALPTLQPGAHTLVMKACNAAGCASSPALIIIKL